ncbi:MAG: hypothetical protein KBH07_13585 [Flavobacteriales bacterium]|nr:hypothetical protein [Flavobacteriales bacterium]MBP9081325.1 hypothetical protein [Flavobacteriales bacterium]
MKRKLLLILPLVLGLAGCLKDELDLSTLTYNPLDPDYTGPALVELVSDTTRVITLNGVAVDTIVEQVIQVRSDLLKPGTDWDLYVTLVNTGEIFDYSSDTPPSDYRRYFHVVPGTSYCFDYQLKVQFSLTKAWRYCTVADP